MSKTASIWNRRSHTEYEKAEERFIKYLDNQNVKYSCLNSFKEISGTSRDRWVKYKQEETFYCHICKAEKFAEKFGGVCYKCQEKKRQHD